VRILVGALSFKHNNKYKSKIVMKDMAEEYGFQTEELESSLKRFFTKNPSGSIRMDGHDYRSPFLANSICYGLNNELIERGKDLDEDDILGKGMGQYLAHTFRLTGKGRKHFGLNI